MANAALSESEDSPSTNQFQRVSLAMLVSDADTLTRAFQHFASPVGVFRQIFEHPFEVLPRRLQAAQASTAKKQKHNSDPPRTRT